MQRFIALLITALLIALACSKSARAQTRGHTDVTTAVLRFCYDPDIVKITAPGTVAARSSQDAVRGICGNRDRFLGHDRLPPSAFGKDLCANVGTLGKDPSVGTDTLGDLEKVCDRSKLASAGTITPLLVNIVTGLGEHIVATARADLVDYVTTNLTDKLCATDETNPLALGKLFPNTCKLFTKSDPSVPVDSLTFAEVKSAFLLDLRDLPKTLPDKAEAIILAYLEKHPKLKEAAQIVGLIVVAVREVYEHRRDPRQILDDALNAILGDPKNGQPPLDPSLATRPCSLTDPNKSKDAPCLAILAAQIVRDFENAYGPGIADKIPQLLEGSIREFCKAHAGADTTDCVIDANYEARWHDKILRLYDALIAFYEELDNLSDNAAKTATPNDISGDSFPELASRMREVLAAIVDLCDDGSEDYKNTSSLYLGVVDVTIAAVGKDFAQLRAGVITVLSNPIIDKKLGTTAKKALTFVVSLAAAKDSGEVKSVIDAVAEPVGTYKEKYGRDTWYFAIESFVGPMYAWQEGQTSNNWDNTLSSRMKRFAAPVGLELMPSCLSGEWVNVGVGVTLIDPLAMASVDTKNQAPDDNLASVLDFGAYLRIGIAKSPVSVVAGASWRPGQRASSDCATTMTCYQGARDVFVGVVADVPIMVIH